MMRETYPCYGRCGLATKVDILLQKLEPNGDNRTKAENRRRESVNALACEDDYSDTNPRPPQALIRLFNRKEERP